jgi:nickel transport protein
MKGTMEARKILRSAALAAALAAGAVAGPAAAHTVWLERAGDGPNGWQVLFGGHGGELEPLEPEKLRTISAIDAQGALVPVFRTDDGAEVTLRFPEAASLVAVHLDNGIWSRDELGQSVNQPMEEVPGAEAATWAVKYHKTILRWDDVVWEPVGQPFEVVPLANGQPRAGEPLRVQVLLHGEPRAGIRIGRGEAGEAVETDARGIATFVPEPGFNKLWAGLRLPVDAPTHTELSYEYLLGFEARP